VKQIPVEDDEVLLTSPLSLKCLSRLAVRQTMKDNNKYLRNERMSRRWPGDLAKELKVPQCVVSYLFFTEDIQKFYKMITTRPFEYLINWGPTDLEPIEHIYSD